MLAKKKLIAILLIVIIVSISIGIYFLTRPEGENGPIFKGGTLTEDETWSGDIFVYESIVVPSGITLTILPGTMIRFKPSRDYREIGTVGFMVAGGTIKAVGSPTAQIWFTSDAPEPINGDWGGIELYDTNESEFKYVILEYAHLGIAQFDSKVNISHSIVRWVNLEGIYAERSEPVFEYNLLYQNGYHEIALENFNYRVVVRNNHFAGTHIPFIAIDSNVTLEGNYFYSYNASWEPALYVAGVSNATIIGNKFDDFDNETAIQKTHATSTVVATGNDFGNGSVPIPDLDFDDIRHHDLGYTPGDPEDQFIWVYASEDETRRVVNRTGAGLGFGWAFEYANGYLWKLDTGLLTRVDPNTGANTTFTINESEILGPRGLCFDGEFFWTNDHSMIIKFELNGSDIVINDSFSIPDAETGGRNGIATDGTWLYISNIGGTILHELYKDGTIHQNYSIGSIDLCGPFTWNGTHFWSTVGNKLQAWTKEGVVVGQIYEVAGGCSGLSWDGTYLWGLYKTCELWQDAKMFQIEIIDDSLI